MSPDPQFQALRSNSLDTLLQTHAASLDRAATLADLQVMLAALTAPFASLQGGEGEKNTPTVGWWLALIELLAATYHWPLATILAMPIAQAICLRHALGHRDPASVPPTPWAKPPPNTGHPCAASTTSGATATSSAHAPASKNLPCYKPIIKIDLRPWALDIHPTTRKPLSDDAKLRYQLMQPI